MKLINVSLTCVKTHPSFFGINYRSISLNVFTISSLLLFEMAKVVDSLNTSPGGFSFSSHQIQLRRGIIHESILPQTPQQMAHNYINRVAFEQVNG